jgi:hypothetical protein
VHHVVVRSSFRKRDAAFEGGRMNFERHRWTAGLGRDRDGCLLSGADAARQLADLGRQAGARWCVSIIGFSSRHIPVGCVLVELAAQLGIDCGD